MPVKCEIVKAKNKKHHVKIYTLSTCGWCKKTKQLLKALDVEYEYIDVDTLTGDDIAQAREEVKKYNKFCTYLIIVIDKGKHVVLWYNDTEIKEYLG